MSGDPLYPASRLDGNQVLTHAFDEATQRLRTTADATIVNADIDVALDASEDNVAIADPNGDFLNINPDGSINIVDVTSQQVLSSQYAEVTGVVMGLTTLVAAYTAVPNVSLQKVIFSGTNIAEYELVINGATKDKQRTYFGSSLNGSFDFNNGLPVPSGQVIEVYVLHTRPTTGDFNVRIQIVEEI